MDENNNLENPNLNNGNINNPNSNINESNQNNNPYFQNTEDNPYYNPYFQSTTIDNSPYFDNSNIALNNDIYNQTYMDVNNSQADIQSNLSSTENKMDNESNLLSNEIQANNQSGLSSDEVKSNNEAHLSNSNNQMQYSNEPLNLFDLNNNADETISNKEINASDLKNNINNTNLDVQNNTNYEPTSNIHINPILSQNINQANLEGPQNLNSNHLDYQSPELNNNPVSYQSQNFDNNQFNRNQTQDFNNNQFNDNSQNLVNNQFESNMQNSNNVFMDESSNSYGSNNDEEFKRTWMGNLYDKANKRRFSIPSFFFGGIYFLYRKLYLFGFIFMLVSCITPIIGMNMILTNLSNPSTMILLSIFITLLPIIINIIYGFAFYPLYKNNINQKLNKYKNEVQSPAQLIDIAKQKGGTSILFVILGVLLSSVISTVALTTILTSSLNTLVNGLFNNNSIQNTLNNNINEISNEHVTYDVYNFYNDYSFEYDSSKWTKNADNKLVYDNYALSYIQSIENIASAGFDINQSQGRSTFFTYLYNLFSSQIDSTTTTLELGSSTFIYDNGIYYSYFDLVYATSIERCYFVLIPEDDIFMEFILSNNDTVISDMENEEVIGYICSTTRANYQDNLDTNNISSTAINETGNNTSNVNINDSEPQSSNSGNSSSNITSLNNGMTITSNSDVNGISIMYNTLQ